MLAILLKLGASFDLTALVHKRLQSLSGQLAAVQYDRSISTHLGKAPFPLW